MYLARGKDGKLGRQTKGRQVRGVGYSVEVASTKGPRFRDVNVTNSTLVLDQADRQKALMQAQAKQAAATQARRDAARAAALKFAEGKAVAMAEQQAAKGRQKPTSQDIIKNYFGRRAQMSETAKSQGDLSRATPLVKDIKVTRTADYKILNECPDTEFVNVISHGADFESQFPVGNPLSPNGTGYLNAGPSTDFDTYVYDNEQNVTRAAGGFDINRNGGNIVGGTVLGRHNGKVSAYYGYGKYGKSRRMGSHPVQASFGRYAGYGRGRFGEDSEADPSAMVDMPEETPDMSTPEKADPVYTQEPSSTPMGPMPAPAAPSFWDRLTSGLESGLVTGATTGVQTAAQQQITKALAPPAPSQPAIIYQNVVGGGKTKAQLLAAATNPVSKFGANLGMSPGMTYGLLALLGVGTAAIVYSKKRK